MGEAEFWVTLATTLPLFAIAGCSAWSTWDRNRRG